MDLAYLLQKYSVSFSFYTVTLGANPNYSVETFYKVIFHGFVYCILVFYGFSMSIACVYRPF